MSPFVRVRFSAERLEELRLLAARTLPAEPVTLMAVELACLVDGYVPPVDSPGERAAARKGGNE